LELKVSPRRTVRTVPLGTTRREAISEEAFVPDLPELIAPPPELLPLSGALLAGLFASLLLEVLFASLAGGLLVHARPVNAR
jgi:hypothetical protein